ncbi:MAG TPA: hypothetical protein VKT49_19290 [Bryobacteraceae bacterium]|nr:hypothetical protein [Bryobacteraceae bacterium]
MNYKTLAIVPVLVLGAAAQEDPATYKMTIALSELEQGLKQAKVMAIGGAVMGPAVKNAPYSATEVTENTQTLADGNRIHRKSQVPVYRDSEGRVRRESSADQITIWDPVANASYILNPKTQIARKLPLGMNFLSASAGQKVVTGGIVRFQDGPGVPALPPPDVMFTALGGGPGAKVEILGPQGKLTPKSESLGKQMIEGVNADGTRMTTTLEAGAIGNDRPIEITSETWYSPDLQTMVKSTHSDPRNGEDTFQLINISRAEPPPTLFQVPAEYQVIDQKLPGGRGGAIR